MMKSLRQSRIAAVAVGATLLVGLGATGSAVADRLIGSAAIKDNSVRSVDVRNGTLAMRDLRPGVVSKIKAPGPQGPAGTPGQALVADVVTPPNPGLGGINVIAVDAVPANSVAPSESIGTPLFDAVELPAGTYLVHTAVQFFDFDGGGDDVDYGVARLFLDGAEVPVSASWTPAIPDDANNAAQSSGSIVVDVPTGGGTLTAKAVIRGGDSGHAGGSMIVTRIG